MRLPRRITRRAPHYLDVATEPIGQLTIDIAAPAEVVFDTLADPAQHPKIDGSATVRRLLRGPRRLSAGSRFSMSMRLSGTPYPESPTAWSTSSRTGSSPGATSSPSAGGTNWNRSPVVPG
jgi:hypothetical protein